MSLGEDLRGVESGSEEKSTGRGTSGKEELKCPRDPFPLLGGEFTALYTSSNGKKLGDKIGF